MWSLWASFSNRTFTSRPSGTEGLHFPFWKMCVANLGCPCCTGNSWKPDGHRNLVPGPRPLLITLPSDYSLSFPPCHINYSIFQGPDFSNHFMACLTLFQILVHQESRGQITEVNKVQCRIPALTEAHCWVS